jgi:hypothetical protein
MSPALRYSKRPTPRKRYSTFFKYLATQPDSIEAKWLLNLAEMTLGNYPDRRSAAVSAGSVLVCLRREHRTIYRRSPAAGLNLFAMASGVIVDDFDNDGLLDVVTSSSGFLRPDALLP